jgi:hypothetical protein
VAELLGGVEDGDYCRRDPENADLFGTGHLSREAMLTSTDGTLIKPEFLGISVPACEGTKRQTDTTDPPYIHHLS